MPSRQTIFVGIIPRAEQNENPPAPGLYRSTDGGDNWTNIFPVTYDTTFRRDVKVGLTPSSPQTVYVYTGGYSNGNLNARLRFEHGWRANLVGPQHLI